MKQIRYLLNKYKCINRTENIKNIYSRVRDETNNSIASIYYIIIL